MADGIKADSTTTLLHLQIGPYSDGYGRDLGTGFDKKPSFFGHLDERVEQFYVQHSRPNACNAPCFTVVRMVGPNHE